MSNNDPRGSFVRWQTITREQLSYAISLILGLSVAALGFELSLILHVEFGDVLVSDKPALLLSYAFATSSAISVIVQGCSTGLGIWVVLNRLADFRLTASIARRR